MNVLGMAEQPSDDAIILGRKTRKWKPKEKSRDVRTIFANTLDSHLAELLWIPMTILGRKIRVLKKKVVELFTHANSGNECS
ncbi:hypothetical protein BaRGS_00025784 [Batillaria attramentaria]|uniref:Uncharacterized protein n=1 Tax=Batillaria attramentaria TaxID=370345 RepID=A0ABD0K6E8_9CAEN